MSSPLGMKTAYKTGRAAYGDFETDALFIISDGKSYGAVDFTQVNHNGKTVFKTPETKNTQLDFVNYYRTNCAWGVHEGLLP